MYQLKMLLDSDAYGIMLLHQLHYLLFIFHSSIHSFIYALTHSLNHWIAKNAYARYVNWNKKQFPP